MNRILTDDGSGIVSHFTLQEITPIHESVFESLELVRAHLNHDRGGGVTIVITDAARSQADNDVLRDKYGSSVSKTSKHLSHTVNVKTGAVVGCVAVDFRAHDAEGERVPQAEVAAVAKLYFDWVKADYTDGHIHADNRYRTGAAEKG